MAFIGCGRIQARVPEGLGSSAVTGSGVPKTGYPLFHSNGCMRGETGSYRNAALSGSDRGADVLPGRVQLLRIPFVAEVW